ncbi:MAG: nucleotidyltransferase family protein [Clostridium sp.]|nr:nucleotidyltransferase family protein [Clostridium sp.]
MNQTEQVFLSLLRDYVCGQKLKALPTVDWQALYNLAQSHNVTGLVGRILADLPTDHRPPKALAVAFRQAMGQTLMSYEKRMVAVQVMEQTLTDAQIPYLTVKGACTAAAYPDPSLRTCGDTDIVLTPEHQREAVLTLEQRGFAKKVTHDDVVMLTLHGFEFELHTRLESINDGSRALLANPFAPEVAYIKSKNIWVLQPVYAVYYTVLHLLHHIKTGGAGVRMLLDTDLLLRKDPTLAPQVLELAERSGLERSFGCILALCKQWLDTPLPCSVPALDTDTVEKFAAVILGGGVFGHGNGNTGAVFLARQKAADGSKTPFTCFVALFRYCFPKADYMAYQFPYLIRRPYLLPFAYLHRFCRGLFRNRTHSAAALQAIAGKNQGAALLHQVWAELDL